MIEALLEEEAVHRGGSTRDIDVVFGHDVDTLGVELWTPEERAGYYEKDDREERGIPSRSFETAAEKAAEGVGRTRRTRAQAQARGARGDRGEFHRRQRPYDDRRRRDWDDRDRRDAGDRRCTRL